MVVLLKKEHARAPDAEVARCVEQMNMYIKGKVPFNFDELDNLELGEESEPQGPLTKDAAKWSPPREIKERRRDADMRVCQVATFDQPLR